MGGKVVVTLAEMRARTRLCVCVRVSDIACICGGGQTMAIGEDEMNRIPFDVS